MHKKISTLIISSLLSGIVYGQNGVSINSSGTSPNASSILDLSDNNNRGVILPNVALTASNTAGPVTSPATGLLIWNTATAGASPNNVTPGLYYNSGTPAAPNWKRVSTGNSDAWTLDGNTNGTFRLIGTNDNLPLGIETNGTEWVRIGTGGNVAIGTTTITTSAALDVTSTSRGVLLPRVALTATNAAGPVTTPATSLLVYNTATAGVAPNNVTPGFYMWDGSVWLRFDVGNNIGDWKLTGNNNSSSPTVPTTYGTSTIGANDNMIGTRNAADVVMATNNIEQMRLISGGRVAIGTAIGTATAMLSVNTYTNALRDGIAIAMSGASSNANGVSITAGNINANGFYYTNSTSALSSAVFGLRAELTSTHIVSGYAAYRNSSGKSYGLFGITGTNAAYTSTNANTWAAFMQGRVVISGEGSPTSLLGTDLEVRNTSLGAGNPAVISIRQSISNTTAGTILGNLNFGDEYATTPQAQIQITRSALSSNSTDLPTDIVLSNTPDNSATLTERMRISQNGNVGMGTSNIPAESRLVLGALDGVNEGGQLQINAPGGSFNTAFFIDNYQNSMRILTGTNTASAAQALSVSSTGVVNISNLSPSLAVYTDALRNLTTTVPTNGQLGYWTRSGTQLWNSNTGDNVGIGTTTPMQTLDVNGRINVTNGVIQKGGVAITGTTDMGLYSRTAGSWMRFVTNGAPVRFFSDDNIGTNYNFTIESNGNVGIGTNLTPAYRLTIGGTGVVFGVDNTANFVAKNSGGAYESYLWPRWSDNIMYMNYGSSGLNLRDNASNTAMFIDASRNVGFPTQTGYKVTVGGDLYVNGGWARVAGSNGYYFETWGGGWQMTDATWLRSYNSKPILATGGLGGYGNGAFGTPFGGNPRIYANFDNVSAGGISVSDDGGFFDYNDSWITYRGSQGLKIKHNVGGSDLMQFDMYNIGGTIADRYVNSSNDNWGYIGISGRSWYRMYSYGFVTASKRELKRDLVPVNGIYADRLMSDLEKMKPTLYKYINEEDSYIAGKETKFRANYHLGLILDESPDYLQDDAFGGLEIYSVATMGVLAGKIANQEVKNVKSSLGWTSENKTIQDFGSVKLTTGNHFIPFNETFYSDLNGAVPVINLTISDMNARVAVTSKTDKGFVVVVESVNNSIINVDYIALAKVKMNGNKDVIPHEIERNLSVDSKSKQLIREFWANDPNRMNEVENEAKKNAEKIIIERKKLIEGQRFDKPENGPVGKITHSMNGPR